MNQEIAPRPDVLSYRDLKPGFVLYTQHRVDQLNSEQELKIRLAGTTSGQGSFVGFTRQSNWDELSSELRAGLSILRQEGDHIVFTNSPRLLDRLIGRVDARQ